MRNKMKSFLGLAISAAMMSSMGINAFAAPGDTFDITIENATNGHTYGAYQLFEGDKKDNYPILSNIEWGSSVTNATELLNLLKADETLGTTFDSCENAEDVAAALSPEEPLSQIMLNQFAKVVGDYFDTHSTATKKSTDEGDTYKIADLESGYYLVMDESDVTLDPSDSKTRYMLQVAADQTVQPKAGVVTVEKKVLEDSLLETEDEMNTYPVDKAYNDVADWDIGQTKSFKLFANLPEEMWQYDAYQLIFNDEFTKGITVTKEDGTPIADGALAALDYKVTYIIGDTETDLASDTFTTLLAKSNGVANGTLSFTADDIKADLVGKGVAADTEVTIAIEYFAKLNENAVVGTAGNDNEVSLTYTSGSDLTGQGTSETETDEVAVFTFALVGTKIDAIETTTTLANAKFKLGRDTNGDNAADEWAVIANGKISSWETDVENVNVTEVVTGADGKFNFTGVDSGTYCLKETEAPEGYNLLDDDIVIVVKSVNGTENIYTQTKTGTEVTGVDYTIGDEVTATANDGIVAFDVKNSQGSKLPETGDTGRIAFYAIGSIGTALCLVFLITKRRMNKYGSSK